MEVHIPNFNATEMSPCEVVEATFVLHNLRVLYRNALDEIESGIERMEVRLANLDGLSRETPILATLGRSDDPRFLAIELRPSGYVKTRIEFLVTPDTLGWKKAEPKPDPQTKEGDRCP